MENTIIKRLEGKMEEVKIEHMFSLIFVIFFSSLLVLIAYTFFAGQPGYTVVAIGFIPFAITPSYFRFKWDVELTWRLDVMIIFAILFHLVGGVFDFYGSIVRYDNYAHFITSALLAFFAMTFYYLMDKYTMQSFKMPLVLIVFFTVATTVTFGVIWEFMEYYTDIIFGTNTQRGLEDTMSDLRIDTVAGILVAFPLAAKIRRGEFQKEYASLERSAKTLGEMGVLDRIFAEEK